MAGSWLKRAIILLLAIVTAYGLYVIFSEKPILVDLAEVRVGPMQVSIAEEGVTRVREVYAISSPIAGHLDRIRLEEGDFVTTLTAIASIRPLDPPFLDDRTRAQLEAGIAAARSAIALAEFEHARAVAARDLAQSNFLRIEKLARNSIVSDSQLEQALSELQSQKALVESAQAGIALRKAELASAQAQLTQPGDVARRNGTSECCVEIRSPIDGIILNVHARSEQAVNMGTVIAEVGDPQDIEIVVDVLSSDAIAIRPGTRVEISDWGGPDTLTAVVRRVDPAAFTKVSALGIEEQRVNIVMDLETVPEGLGHGYRVFARLVIWSADNITQIPIGGLFRSGGHWSAFVVRDNIARSVPIEIGQINETDAQILSGLTKGDRIILYPSDQLKDGGKVMDRANAN